MSAEGTLILSLLSPVRELEDYMSDRVQFVITAQEWDPSFEEALMDNPSLVFVHQRWIYSCNKKQRLLPHQLYGVVSLA